MFVTASTVLDTPENVQRFVSDNLAMGVDHLVVFCDAPGAPGQDEVVARLREHDHVTCVPTGADWWAGDRPSRLNVRQRINANLAIEVLRDVAEVDWVCHLDGDEVAVVDHEVLAGLPREHAALWLSPLEAVSRPDATERPTLFKRLLDDEELQLLAVLGVIDEPSNQALFHGHVLGKSAVRPHSGLGLALHDAVELPGRRLPAGERFEHPALRVLHYDAVSRAEFVRKWRAMTAAGPLSLRADRAPLAHALRALLRGHDRGRVSDAHLEKYLGQLYERTTRDDVAVLDELGLLEERDPRTGDHRPRPLPSASAGLLDARLEELATAPKRRFHVNHGTSPQPSAGARGRLRRALRGRRLR
jgi:hypothetical protein